MRPKKLLRRLRGRLGCISSSSSSGNQPQKRRAWLPQANVPGFPRGFQEGGQVASSGRACQHQLWCAFARVHVYSLSTALPRAPGSAPGPREVSSGRAPVCTRQACLSTGHGCQRAWAVRAGVPRTLAETSLSSSGPLRPSAEACECGQQAAFWPGALALPCSQLLETELSFLTVWGPKTSDFN